MTDGYRIVIWLTDEEIRASMGQREGILRRKISDELNSIFSKINKDVKEHYMENEKYE